jgi:hypothetical protein
MVDADSDAAHPAPAGLQGTRATVDVAHIQVQELLKGYDKNSPPMHNFDEQVDVTVSLKLTKLLELNARDRTVTMAGWLRRFWQDPRLAFDLQTMGAGWNAKEDFLQVDQGAIWTPDTALLNSVDFNKGELCQTVNAFVYATGARSVASGSHLDLTQDTSNQESQPVPFNVMLVTPCVFKVRCDISAAYFPFDTNVCPLMFEPWSSNFLRLQIAADAMKSQVNLPEFNVRMYSATTENIVEHTTGGKWPRVTIKVEIARHAHYYVVNIVCPILLLVVVCWFTLWVPIGLADRVAYMMTLVLTGMATTSMNAERRPATDTDTWLDDFQTTALLLLVFATFFSIMVLRLLPPSKPDAFWSERQIWNRTQLVNMIESAFRIAFFALAAVSFGWLFVDLEMYESKGHRREKNFSGRATLLMLIAIGGIVIFKVVMIVLSCFPPISASLGGVEDSGIADLEAKSMELGRELFGQSLTSRSSSPGPDSMSPRNFYYENPDQIDSRLSSARGPAPSDVYSTAEDGLMTLLGLSQEPSPAPIGAGPLAPAFVPQSGTVVGVESAVSPQAVSPRVELECGDGRTRYADSSTQSVPTYAAVERYPDGSLRFSRR